MTFEAMALSLFGELPQLELARVTEAMMEGYISGLQACSWRYNGTAYIGDGPGTRSLREVIDEVRRKGGTI